MKNIKQTIPLLILVLFLMFGIFGSPTQGVRAEDPSYRYLYIDWIYPPPDKVCRDDTVTVMFQYTVMNFYASEGGAVVGLPGNREPNTFLFAGTSLSGSSISPRKWNPSFLLSSGTQTAKYKATKIGTDRITISGTGVWPEGATTDYFDVVNCAYEISIGASYYVDDPHVKIDTELHGKATVIDDQGVLEGDGTYQYNVTIDYTPPDSITCDRIVKSTNESTFAVTGTASTTMVNYEIQFHPVQLKEAAANCIDRDRKHIQRSLFPGGSVDVQKEIHIVGNFQTSKSQLHFKFPFGNGGTLDVWIIKRVPK